MAAASDQWWACKCCGKQPQQPYSGYVDEPPYPYPFGPYYAPPHGPCDCCGGDAAVVIFTDAKNPDEPVRRDWFGGPCPPCASPGLLTWRDLIGQSIALNLCGSRCDELKSWRAYWGCKSFDVKFYSIWQQPGGAPCDKMGKIFIAIHAWCARENIGPGEFSNRRLVGFRMGYGVQAGPQPPCNPSANCVTMGPTGVSSFLAPDGSCIAIDTEATEKCDNPPAVVAPFAIGSPGGVVCTASCGGATTITGVDPVTPDRAGIYSVKVIL